MQCEKMKTDRDIMFSEREKQCPNFHMVSGEDKIIYMLSASGCDNVESGLVLFKENNDKKRQTIQTSLYIHK